MRTMSTILCTFAFVTVAFAGTPALSGPGPDVVAPGEVVVGFAPGTLPDVVSGDAWRGFVVLDRVPAAPFLVLQAESVAVVSEALADQPGLRYIEPNGIVHSLATPDDPRYADQYGPGMMGFPAAWDAAGYGAGNVTLAVLDTGIQRDHPDLDAALLLQGYDHSNDDVDPADDCGHGTHVSGTVGAWTDNGIGVAGMSRSSLLPMKVLAPSLAGCSGSHADIAQAIYDATAQGADVISMSLGGKSGSTTLRDAVDHAWQSGVLVVAAAGNDGPCLLACVSYPAAYESVIAVGALTSSKSKATYSSTGPQVEIAAPGSRVLSTYNDGDYRTLSGTSMATPHVAGAFALALSCRPETSAQELRGLLHETAEDLGSAGRDPSYGYGLARVDEMIARLGPCSDGTDGGDGGDGNGDGTDGGNGGDGNGDGGDEEPNASPTATFTHSSDGLDVAVDGSGSSDPDGDPLTFHWDLGDGTTATGMTATHRYAASGTYTITLTVDDGNGGTDSAAQAVDVTPADETGPDDPDPGAPTVANGETVEVRLAAGEEVHHKIAVPSGQGKFEVVMTGPACGLLSCPIDADLYVRQGERASDDAYDCRPYRSSNDEVCTFSDPAADWWYIRIVAYKGSGTVSFTASHG